MSGLHCIFWLIKAQIWFLFMQACIQRLWNFTVYFIKVYFQSSADQSLWMAKGKTMTLWKMYIITNSRKYCDIWPVASDKLGFKMGHFSTLAVTVHLKIPHRHLNELSLVICGYRDRWLQFSVMKECYFFHMNIAERQGKNWPRNEWMCQEFAWSA